MESLTYKMLLKEYWIKDQNYIDSLIQEIKLDEKIINVYEADFLDKHNPIRKIPTLVVNDPPIVNVQGRPIALG